MKNILSCTVPAFLALACSTSAFQGSSKNSAANLTQPADANGQATVGVPSGNGAGTGAGGAQPGNTASVCPPVLAKTKATPADPSGVGAAYSSDNSGTQPCNAALGSSGGKALIGDPATTVVIGGNQSAGAAVPKSQQDALTSCLKLWGFHSPFQPNRARPDKIIFGNLELGPANRLIDAVLGTEFSGITDEEVTAQPSLILIIGTINLGATHFILPEVTYKFHNPRGWYCVDFGLDIASSTKVELKKGAQLADSRFDLSILSSSPATAAHQVSILSHTDIVTIP